MSRTSGFLGWRILAGAILVAGLIATPVTGSSAVAEASGPESGAASPPEIPAIELTAGSGVEPAAADRASALAAAAQLGEPVEAADLTTETERHLANPDGSMTFEAFAVAQRVRTPAGWTPVDTTLQVVGSRVKPVASALNMSFSGGGSSDLIELLDGDRRLALAWPAPLPSPVLDGDTATYRDVFPGVDLVVRAEADSFAQTLVVHTREAAQNPALAKITWRVTLEGLSLRVEDDHSVTAADAFTGEVVFSAPPSVMFDAPTPSLATDAGDRGPSQLVTMPTELTGGELSVRPDLAMLNDPATTFPVSVDPSFSKGVTNWAPVFRENPTKAWPSGSSSPRDSLRVGLLNWPGCGSWCGLWRSHLRFNIEALHGEQLVANPEFRITLDHSASCGATPVSLWRTSTIDNGSGATWNSMKDKWVTDFGDRSGSANESDCPKGDDPMEWSTATMRDKLQGAINAGNHTFTFGLRAQNEGDKYQWKRFHASTARLVATYNSPPLAPDRLVIDGDCYLQCDSPAVVRTLRPFLQARVRDSHGASMTVEFQVRSGSTVVSSGTVSSVAHGANARWRPPSNLPQQALTFRVRAKNAHLTGPWSSNFSFTPDTTVPALPSVSGNPYKHKDTGAWSGGVGQPGSFTFTAGSSDTIEYGYRWLGGSETRVRVTPGANHTVQLTPPGDLEQVLEVRALDVAGNTSGWRAYPFYVRPQPTDVAYWKFDDGSGQVAAPSTGGSKYAGVLHGNATWAPSGINPDNPSASGTAVLLTGTGDFVEMPQAVATNHAAGFTVTAWVNPSEFTGFHTVVSQSGANTTMFAVYYTPENPRWCLRVNGTDDPVGERAWACSPLTPELNTWTHLAAVYDKPAGKIRLWVNGGPNNGEPIPGTVTEVDAPLGEWAATGSFTVGRAYGGSYFHGRIDEVRVHQRVLGEFEIQHTFLQCRYAACPPVPPQDEPVLVGWWDLNDASGTVAADSSGLGYDATLVGSAAWTPDGRDGTPAIRFANTAGWLDTGDQIIVADQSFTVSAWVRLDQDTGAEQWIAHAYGANDSAYKLYYQEPTNTWRFALVTPEGGWRIAVAAAAPVIGEWTHLVGVYDRATGQVRIYVNGQLQGSASGAIGQAVTSNLYIGSSITGGFRVAGTIDSVRAYQSALTPAQVLALFQGTGP